MALSHCGNTFCLYYHVFFFSTIFSWYEFFYLERSWKFLLNLVRFCLFLAFILSINNFSVVFHCWRTPRYKTLISCMVCASNWPLKFVFGYESYFRVTLCYASFTFSLVSLWLCFPVGRSLCSSPLCVERAGPAHSSSHLLQSEVLSKHRHLVKLKFLLLVGILFHCTVLSMDKDIHKV